MKLSEALERLASMKSPSVESILHSHGYEYEAEVIAVIVRAQESEGK